MPKIMLIDAAQPEETRVAVMDGKRLDNFDIESVSKKQLKGNIYLAKVTRVEPSLQAAFVSYGGNRHGFLPFAEIHPDYYRIPVEDRERLLAEQEELSRQLQAEAKAREERELAEAEAAAEAGVKDVENMTAEAMDAEAGLDVMEIAEIEEADIIDTDETDDLEDVPSAEETEDEDAETQASAEDAADAVEPGEETATDADDRRSGRGGRGRGRRRGRNRGRGLERRPDQVTDRNEGEDEETAVGALWKRMHRSYKIQEVIKRGQIMLIQVVKEERGNKGAAVTTYITMPGRYCVLMPNSPQSGGVSRKVSSHAERRKMRDLLDELQMPHGMSVILRTAGVDRAPEEVKRDFDYLMRLWDKVRDTTMQSTAPALIHEEGSLVKRAVRDLLSSDIGEILVEGVEAAETARDMMAMMMPERAGLVREYNDTVPLFIKYGAEPQIDAIHSNTVTLRSGGYLVINPTEALVSIDINSGRATRERHIEETALKTNLEAADEIARQLRLRDLGGLVVIDFIDMESRRHNAMVEKRMRDALSGDRARVQVGRISSFGLMELSRQRLRPSLTETHFHTCPHCRGLGVIRTTEAMALAVLRAIETVGMENRAGEVRITVTEDVATFLFNAKRATLTALEGRYDLCVVLQIAHVVDSDQGFVLDITRSRRAERLAAIDTVVDGDLAEDEVDESGADSASGNDRADRESDGESRHRQNGRRRGRRGGRGRDRAPADGNVTAADEDIDDDIGNRKQDDEPEADGNNAANTDKAEDGGNAKRRGRSRGGRGKGRGGRDGAPDTAGTSAPGGEAETPARAIEQDMQRQPARSYEIVNEVTGDKKKGWWKKLTG